MRFEDESGNGDWWDTEGFGTSYAPFDPYGIRRGEGDRVESGQKRLSDEHEVKKGIFKSNIIC